jgi:hypothetical protein
MDNNVIVTLVHGTWPRGLFPRLRRSNRAPCWFEEGSAFRNQLTSSFSKLEISHSLRTHPWSGANSIFHRDITALDLANRLAADDKPNQVQLIIAHSHGGNVALRALRHLQALTLARQSEEAVVIPLVVTMATPFVEVRPFSLPKIYGHARLMEFGVIWFVLGVFGPSIYTYQGEGPGFPLFILAFSCACGFYYNAMNYYIDWKGRVTKLQNATDLTAAPSSILIVRAVDDEASLVLAFGAILNRLAPKITMLLVRFFVFALLATGLYLVVFSPGRIWTILEDLIDNYTATIMSVTVWSSTIVMCSLMVSRSVHGREMAIAPSDCQVNAQSVPDGVALSRIVTLVSDVPTKGLRHGIYEHDHCVDTISNWVSGELARISEQRSQTSLSR